MKKHTVLTKSKVKFMQYTNKRAAIKNQDWNYLTHPKNPPWAFYKTHLKNPSGFFKYTIILMDILQCRNFHCDEMEWQKTFTIISGV